MDIDEFRKGGASTPIYELRVYHAAEGKLEALIERFRNHTIELFANHGMAVLAFWTPTDGEAATNTLIYIIKHASRAAAKESWEAFQADSHWIAVKAASETEGKLATSIDSTYMSQVQMPLKPT